MLFTLELGNSYMLSKLNIFADHFIKKRQSRKGAAIVSVFVLYIYLLVRTANVIPAHNISIIKFFFTVRSPFLIPEIS